MQTRAPSWFTDEELAGLDDFWRVYEANAEALERQTTAAALEDPALAAIYASLSPGQVAAERVAGLERVRRAIRGDWAAYEANLRTQGVLYAGLEIPFPVWFRLVAITSRELTPRLVMALGDDRERLSASLRAMQAFFDLAISVLGEAYLLAQRDGSSFRPPRRTVLLVDDDHLMARVVTRALSPAHQVEVVNTVDAALGLLRHGTRFDVILCDLLLPEKTGVEFYRAVATEFPGEESHIVFITGGAFTPTARAFLQTVPNLRLEKPFELERLRTLVNAAGN